LTPPYQQSEKKYKAVKHKYMTNVIGALTVFSLKFENQKKTREKSVTLDSGLAPNGTGANAATIDGADIWSRRKHPRLQSAVLGWNQNVDGKVAPGSVLKNFSESPLSFRFMMLMFRHLQTSSSKERLKSNQRGDP
jgi:hypothetical protein